MYLAMLEGPLVGRKSEEAVMRAKGKGGDEASLNVRRAPLIPWECAFAQFVRSIPGLLHDI